MAKPIITKRLVKGAALDYQELDDNFQNIIDSILTVTDGTSDINLELIDTLEITGDHNIKITATPSGNIVTVDNELPVITKSPHGFENIIDTSLSFDDTTRTFTITLDPLLDDFSVFLAGEEFLKTASETVVIPNTTGLYLIYYNSSGVLSQKTGYLTFGQEAAVAHVYWNATTSDYKLADQRHGVTMDWKTHEYLHRTRGASFASGFAASNYTLTGDGSANADAQIDLSSGTFYDEDLKINITHSNTPTANTYQQDLQGPAQIPVAYHSGSTGEWVFDAATDYPVKVGTIAKYNLNTAGTWSTPDITSTHFVAMWLVATNFYDTPIIAIMGQRSDNKLEDAENNNTWDGLDLTNFPSEEFLPLYRLIFRSSTAYTNTPKSYLADIQDLRQATSGAGTGVSLAPNAFGTVAVAGQNSVIADSVNDTLTLVAGTGITLTTSDTADSVTIATSGSGTVNTGVANALAYYPSAGTTVDDSSFTQVATGHLSTIGANDLILSTNSNTNSSNITINDGISGTVNINTELSYLSIKRNGSSGLIKVDAESGFIYSENSDNLSLYAVGTTSPTINLNAANGNITVTAGSTGDVLLNADTLRVGDSNANATITTNGTGDLILNTNSGTNSGSITIADGTNGDITIAPNGTGKTSITNIVSTEPIYDNGNSGAATITPNAVNGATQKYTLTGNITWNAFGTPVAGQSMTMILVQDGTGGRTLTSTMKFAGASKTLSTAANAIDIITVYYDGTTYYASLSKGFA